MRPLLILGCLSCLLAVFLGALGAHFLSSHMVEAGAANFATANLYHMFHSLGLLAMGLSWPHVKDHDKARIRLRNGAISMAAGIVCFSGMLYVASVSSLAGFHWLIPIGGLLFMAGWLAFAVAVYTSRK